MLGVLTLLESPFCFLSAGVLPFAMLLSLILSSWVWRLVLSVIFV